MADLPDDLTKIRLDFLKTEMTILAGKAKDTVDNLWRIRVYTYTFWFACIGAGLAGLGRTTSPDIIWAPVWLSFLPPLIAAYVDATYHGWYRLIVLREGEIEKFLNEENYSAPSASTSLTPSHSTSLANRVSAFPIYDLGGFYTFGCDHPRRRWAKDPLRSLASGTPLLVYGSQLVGSALIVYSFIGSPSLLRYSGVAAVPLAMVALLIASRVKRRKHFAKRPNLAPPQ